MDAYQLLIQRARERRDGIISAARDEYHRTLLDIEALRSSLGDKGHRGPGVTVIESQTIPAMMQAVMPKDRPFTLKEILVALRETHPKRQFRMQMIRSLLQRLANQGVILRLHKTDPILWAVAERDPSKNGYAEVSIPDACELILRECGPLAMTQLVVELQGRGFRADSNSRVLMDSIRRAFGHYKGRFERGRDGRWVVS